MTLIDTQSEYHVALNGEGLILQGAPGSPAYVAQQAPLYNTRFGQGDRSYSDFSFWWFMAQTAFSGYKQEKLWEDDGYFFESEGIDLDLIPGSVVLPRSMSVDNSIIPGDWYAAGDATGTTIVMGRATNDQKMSAIVASTGSTLWQDSTTGANEKVYCTGELGDGKLWFGCQTKGSGASRVKQITSAGSVSDVGTYDTSAVVNLVPYPSGDAMIAFTATDGIYSISRSGTFTQLMTGYPLGLDNLSFSFGLSVKGGTGAWLSGDKIYFMLFESGGFSSELWYYDLTDDVYVMAYRFGAGINPQRGIEFNGNIYLFDVNNKNSHIQIWKYNTTSGQMDRIHEIGRTTTAYALVANPAKDAEHIYFTVDDGTSDYQIWAIDSSDDVYATISPPSSYATHVDLLFVAGSGYIGVVRDGVSGTNKIAIQSTSYLTTGYIISSAFDANIPAIDKLFREVTINFAALASGQSLQVLYSVDNGANYTSLGTASYTSDGAISNKSFPFGDAVVGKSILIKIVLTGGGSNTPELRDFSVKFVPFVNYTKVWNLRINAGDEVRRLNGGLVTKTARELKSILENAWWTKSILDFQDLDYASTAINDGDGITASDTTITVDSTANFPEQGRILIDNEQIFYTGKTPTTFTGCTRGARETRATTHANDAVVNNAYKVILTGLDYQTPILLEGKNLEYIISLQVREV